jgi:hypothetical protein
MLRALSDSRRSTVKASKWALTIGLALSALALAACGSSGGGKSTEGNEELFTTAGFQKAYDAVKEKGGGKPALQVQITQGGADFKLRDGEKATGFLYTGGDVHSETVNIIGPGSIQGTDFPFSEIDPAAIDKIVSGVKSESGIDGIKVTVMTLDRDTVDGKLVWTINAEGGGRTGLVYNADADGSNVTSPLGNVAGSGGGQSGTTTGTGGGVTTPNGKTPQEIVQCIQQAGGDPTKIQACSQ